MKQTDGGFLLVASLDVDSSEGKKKGREGPIANFCAIKI